MATSGAISDGNDCPRVIEKGAEEVLRCFNDPSIHTIYITGWEGVGRLQVAEYAAKKAKECFDVFLWVTITDDCNPHRVQMRDLLKLQRRIAKCLGIQVPTIDDDDDDDGDVDDDDNYVRMQKPMMRELAKRIYAQMVARRFLLVLISNGRYVRKDSNRIMLKDLGVPYPSEWDNKMVVVVTSPLDPVSIIHGSIEAIDGSFLHCKLVVEKEKDAWDLFQRECKLVVNSPRIQGRISPNSVLECFMYFTLFLDSFESVSELVWFWIAEGLIPNVDLGRALSTELEHRSMCYRNSNDDEIDSLRLDDHIRRLATSFSTSPDGRFLVRHDLSLSEAPKTDDWEKHGIERISMCYHSYTEKVLVPSPKCLTLSTLVLHGRNLREIPESFFKHMINLRVLVLCETNIKSLPTSLSYLRNLRLLHLGFSKLKTLTPHLNSLEKLEIIIIRSKALTEISDIAFQGLHKLTYLDLSHTESLESLSMLLCNTVRLKKLSLRKCSSLKTICSHLQHLSALEDLDLSECTALTDVRDLSSFGCIMPQLRFLDLSNIPHIQHLSIRGHPSLEKVSLGGLTDIQVLDLSETNLKKLPTQISELTSLRRLDMVEMKHMMRVDWKNIDWLPQELNYNQGDGFDHMRLNRSSGACISVRNAEFFRSLELSSSLWKNCFTHFRFSLGHGRHLDKDTCFQREQFLYNVFLETQINRLTYFQSNYDRCLEISETESCPVGVSGVLSHTQFFSLYKNNFVIRLSDLGDLSNMKSLMECRIERCSEMEAIFLAEKTLELDILPYLERMYISNLANLRSVTEGSYGRGSFARLKHVYLEHCPKLESVFSSNISLQSIETLEIKFCSRLKEVFRGAICGGGSPGRLHTIILWKLRKLETICNAHLQALRKMNVRGCPKLKKIPLHDVKHHGSIIPQAVISGELEWWNNLVWADVGIKDRIYFKEWRHYGV